MNLFTHEQCPKCINCEYAGNKSWYITFKNEEDALNAFQHLKVNVATYNGRTIFARIKTHPVPRSSTSTVVTSTTNTRSNKNISIVTQSDLSSPTMSLISKSLSESALTANSTVGEVKNNNLSTHRTETISTSNEDSSLNLSTNKGVTATDDSMSKMIDGYVASSFLPAHSFVTAPSGLIYPVNNNKLK